ncbi:hypothetical protein PHJA_002296500 [Phtheirospermum japonicum]|uniref:Uncharacterized protein n=1 Tax=Phtheirospermum japonicum TaxID=374723 RepID=A0A830D2S0_9LAMI|nr:hypothetical protein PHJA_002296500 [Phtheirospermum japonicum]
MAMSRFLSQSLPRSSPHYPAAALMSHHRHHSSKSRRAQLNEVTEIDQASSSSADPGGEAAAEIIALGIKRIEDAIHNIIVLRSAPDWLPFLSGSSYWVPPRASAVRRSGAASQHRAESMIDVVEKLAALRVKRNQGLPLDLLLEDENMSFTSTKGWPASSFYIEGNRFELDSVFDRNGYMERLKFDL